MIISKKTVVITGSSRGIGKSIAINFARLNYNVIINYNKSEKEAHEVLNEIRKFGTEAIAVKADVSNFKETENLFRVILENFGNLDVLVNNAGINLEKIFQNVTENEWKRLFDINIGGMFNCSSFAVKHMINKKQGNIINISSIWGIVGASMEVHYSASKAAVIGFTKALARELAPSGIMVNCVAPGVINTDMNGDLTNEEIKNIESKIPFGTIGAPENIAKSVVFLANDAQYMTGQVISPNGGIVT